MKGKMKILDVAVAACVLVAAVFMFLSVRMVSGPSDSAVAARIMTRGLESRISLLEEYSRRAMLSPASSWLELDGMPDDMVIYKYKDDSLLTWKGEFPTTNDDLGGHTYFVTLNDPQYDLESPLEGLGEKYEFKQIGPKWFVVHRVDEGAFSVVSGLQIDASRPPLSGDFSIVPISETGGDVVTLHSEPLFKVIYEYSHAQFVHNGRFLWISVLVILAALFVFLYSRKTPRVFLAVAFLGTLLLTGLYFWGMTMGSDLVMFSPILYADGPVLYSFAALVIINLELVFLISCLYVCRSSFHFGKVGSVALIALSVAVFVYVYFATNSIILNSGINLELYKVSELTLFTGVYYASFVFLLVMPVLLLQMCDHVVDSFSPAFGAVYAVLVGGFLLLLTSTLGYNKEQGKLEVWANRLAVDRDISLELQLRSIEPSIASDALVNTFSMMNNSSQIILSHLTESYLRRVSQDYAIAVYIYNPEHRDYTFDAFLAERMNSGTPLFDGSRFVFSLNAGGHARYTGLFSYYSQVDGLRHMMVVIEPKLNRQDRGYASLLGYSEPGKLVIPSRYSYAKYKDGVLSIYKGSYPYPTSYGADLLEEGSFVHFRYDVSDNETVVISRPGNGVFNYVTAFMLMSLVIFLFVQLPAVLGSRRSRVEKNYFRKHISGVLMSSLVITLVSMAVVSVTFVYKRTNANMNSMMSEKVVSLQSQVESRCRYALTTQDLDTQEMTGILEVVRDIARADITLYTVDGIAFKSTSPEFFQRSASGIRLDSDAYNNIVNKRKLYYIGRNKYQDDSYYSLYAPVFNDAGIMIAILSSPYSDDSYDLQRDAAIHTVTIISLFLILLIVARFLAMNVVGRIFRPLLEMSRKMNASNVEQLEYLSYDRDDEISDLVSAYNSMVKDLSASTRELAVAERENAWSGMARSVAHEINNSLSPMKLQLQRLIRLKERNAPGWESRFDEISKVVLDQIDLLSDTATQFLTFAKLLSENPVEFDLDRLVGQQCLLFEGREGISLEYMGLEGAVVRGPKPQLTRVLVNLITNAIQAVEGMEGGRVLVSLRKSTDDGWYDVVVEDNGPGVSEENLSKLFTPNFTTKNSGTGIGLAICKSILDMCGASISYSRSFVLGGAAFIVHYPALKQTGANRVGFISDGRKSL